MLSKKLKNEIVCIENEIDYFLKMKKEITFDEMYELIVKLEKHRFKIIHEIEFLNTHYNMNIENVTSKCRVEIKDFLKIYIYEIVPGFDKLGNYAYKNMMMNLTKTLIKYKGLYYGKKVGIVVHCFFNEESDSSFGCVIRNVKFINDALVHSRIIEDDSDRIVTGLYMYGSTSLNQHIEVSVFEDKNEDSWTSFLKKYVL